MLRAESASKETTPIEGTRLEELYLSHAHSAKRIAYLLTGDAALADDLVQDAFVRLAGRFVDFRHPDAFSAYLRKTIVNLARSRFRRSKHEREHFNREAGRRESHSSLPDVALKLEVRAALMKLNIRQRTALVLRYYADLPDAQIADLLGCRIGTVKSLVSRGAAALRAELRGGSHGS
ncbi:MAG TPA: SigE family RNA polymerase sigma factor [Actinomycetota bacterium]